MRFVCYNQTIYDDSHVELDEYAGLTLGVREGKRVKTMYDQAAILIMDNDCKFVYRGKFLLATYTSLLIVQLLKWVWKKHIFLFQRVTAVLSSVLCLVLRMYALQHFLLPSSLQSQKEVLVG